MTVVVAENDDERHRLKMWLSDRLPGYGVETAEFLEILGFHTRNLGFCGAVAYTEFDGRSIQISCAGDKGWLTRAHLQAVFGYPFLQLGCVRITTFAARHNKTAKRLNWKLGFKHEGVLREHMNDGSDAFVFGMLKRECKWLRKQENGKI